MSKDLDISVGFGSRKAVDVSLVFGTPPTPVTRTVAIPLPYGTAVGGKIVWYADNGNFKATQTKGNGIPNVPENYIATPRIYKGHILQVEGLNGINIASVSLYYEGNYYGSDLAIGTALNDENGNVIDDPAAVARSLGTSPSGLHMLTVQNRNGTNSVYIQNNNTTKSVQLRLRGINLTYYKI